MNTVVDLGEKLFFDTILSGSNSISCSTCHRSDYQWTEPLPVGNGHLGDKLTRRTPTILNTAFNESFFWDGRAATLEEQALGPIQSEKEMGQNLDELMVELKEVSEYVNAFNKFFPGPISPGITPENLAKAIAEFERTKIVGVTPYERWLDGDDSAMNHPAQMGFQAFKDEEIKCSTCHDIGGRHDAGNGRFITSFTDNKFWDIGINENKKSPDLGRWTQLTDDKKSDPNNINQKFAFKTPSLWNVACRAPYMHDGSKATLSDVVDMYSDGGELKDAAGNRVTRPSISEHIKPLNLSRHDKHHIIEFLKALSDDECAASL